MVDLTRLSPILEQLAHSAAEVDRRRGEQTHFLFDVRLFACRSRLLVPCVNETQAMLKSMINEQQAGILNSERAQHLSEKLVAQIEAIQREIQTQAIRRAEPKHYSHYKKPISDLYQDLAQHQEWERRLDQMVREKEKQVTACASYTEQQKLQKELLTTEQRLVRCRAAMIKLEQRITYREQND